MSTTLPGIGHAPIPSVYLEILNEPRVWYDALWLDTQLFAYQIAELDENIFWFSGRTNTFQFQDDELMQFSYGKKRLGNAIRNFNSEVLLGFHHKLN